MDDERMKGAWDKDEARRILSQTALVIDQATRLARETIVRSGPDIGVAREIVDELGRIVGSLSEAEISTSRSTPWIGRSQARKLISLSSQLKSILDVGAVVKMAMDLTNQARSFIDMMNRVEKHWGQDDYEEGEWERYLTEEQLLQIMTWVEAAKHAC